MNMTYLSIGILLAIALYFGLQSISAGPEKSIAEQLRLLLQARANGSLSEEEFAQRQAALYAALLQPRSGNNRVIQILGGVLIVIVASVAAYNWRAKPQTPAVALPAAGPLDTHIGNTIAAPNKAMNTGNVGGDLTVMVKRLADKMAKNPEDGEGWLLLARTYSEINQPKDAAAAYAKAAALLPPDATLLADWANVYVVANGGKWDSKARKIVQRALAADGKHVKTLSLAGTEAFDRADYKTAIDYWKRMQAASEAGSMDAKLAEANIQEAEALRSGKKPVPFGNGANASNPSGKTAP